ncbi:MAG: hypothetical protein L0Y72_07890 [Gemmataceae bacterium]|nr:hypothetical protein [Gemmataceae bacterium]MCI0738950.1 hypothetical protein [Gemmataceae bacterium]
MATFQKVGNAKQGGNVASYFCTPDGQVLHLIAGPVNAATFLREARWANETWNLAQLEKQSSPAELRAFFSKAHRDRLVQRPQHVPQNNLPDREDWSAEALGQILDGYRHLNAVDRVHVLLSVAPLPPIERVYQNVFEKILSEQISTNPVSVRR